MIVCVCVCVCEREREWERKRKREGGSQTDISNVSVCMFAFHRKHWREGIMCLSLLALPLTHSF
jgi:hypothetical protein